MSQMLPMERQRAPTGLHFQTFNGEKRQQQKLLQGRRKTSLSEGLGKKRLKVATLTDGESCYETATSPTLYKN